MILRFLGWVFLILVVVGVGGGGTLVWGYYSFAKAGKLPANTDIVVPKGARFDEIVEVLVAAKVIENRFVFTWGTRLLGQQGRLRSGDFCFPRAVSAQDAAQILVDGAPVVRRQARGNRPAEGPAERCRGQVLYQFTIAEGLTTYQVLERLARVPLLEGAITEKPGEGELLPDTYTYTRGESRDQIVRRMKQLMDDALALAWSNRRPDLPLKDKRELLILASIVEKETGEGAERARVAGVFVNRIVKRMKLETDPTVIYGITEGKGALGRRLLLSDLRNPHPYNTYVHDGLPPGPIANPGLAAIRATAQPEQHNFIFFVADGSGGHAFAETLAEHNRNVERWRRIRQERGN
jgi:UPF0755 protein